MTNVVIWWTLLICKHKRFPPNDSNTVLTVRWHRHTETKFRISIVVKVIQFKLEWSNNSWILIIEISANIRVNQICIQCMPWIRHHKRDISNRFRTISSSTWFRGIALVHQCRLRSVQWIGRNWWMRRECDVMNESMAIVGLPRFIEKIVDDTAEYEEFE